MIAELDEKTLGLRKRTVTVIDDRAADEPFPEFELSNFSHVEDPATGHIVITLGRYMAKKHRPHPGYGTHTYVIEVK